ncbi:SDR family oxidoreductase [Sphingomonas sp. 2R-10]|uniref:SDR family oxidoreductase n=1 Tax=Sphingomonas sp. 2R-10 TaxID=3045148 RepID=UPI000F76B98A|nr:SDR family oxidoreductase [Sphingomonas sp. 2R-10]MDJ0278108.1 SDR family oxidoreductase [Sphingomonas sp. 2R-10]
MSRPLALVTGSFRRLGGVIAVRLAQAGHDVALHATADGDPDATVVAGIAAAGAWCERFAADLSDGAATAGLIPAVAARFGRRVDLLVNNASCFRADDDALPSPESLVAHFAVNAAAPFVLATALAGQGGRAVVNILDQRIAHPHRDQLAYTLSKQALAEATRTLALALAPAVRVNGVAPGLTLATGDYTAGQLDRLAAMMPLERLPTAGQVADAVLFLAGAGASTGQLLFVDGGAGLVRYERDFVHLAR